MTNFNALHSKNRGHCYVFALIYHSKTNQMKSLITSLTLTAALVIGCNAPQKASENIKAETVATEIVDSVAMELENAKAGIDDAAQELDNAIKELN
jgi:hypothetical protein